MHVFFYYNLLTDMYFLITGFGDEMEESGLEEAVLVQEEDADEEEETGSSTKARFWNIHFQVSALASVSLRIKVNRWKDADVVEPTFLPTEAQKPVSVPPGSSNGLWTCCRFRGLKVFAAFPTLLKNQTKEKKKKGCLETTPPPK